MDRFQVTMKPENHEHVKFTIDRRIAKAFDRVAKSAGIPKSWLMRQLIQELVDANIELFPESERQQLQTLLIAARGR